MYSCRPGVNHYYIGDRLGVDPRSDLFGLERRGSGMERR